MNIIIIITETVSVGASAIFALLGAILAGFGAVISWPVTIVESAAGVHSGDYSGMVLIVLFIVQIIIAISISSPGMLFVSMPLTMVFLVWLSDKVVGGGSSEGVMFTYYLAAAFMGICLAVIPAFIVTMIIEKR